MGQIQRARFHWNVDVRGRCFPHASRQPPANFFFAGFIGRVAFVCLSVGERLSEGRSET